MAITTAIYQLKTFVSYLENTHLDEAAATYVKLLKEAQLRLLEPYMHLSEAGLIIVCREKLHLFFCKISEDTAYKAAEEYFYQWYPYQLESNCYHKIRIEDILLFFNIQKQLLFHFIPCFTGKASESIVIASEIERFLGKVERTILTVHEKLQQEDLVKSQHLLSEAQAIAHVGSWEWHIPTDKVIFSDEMYRIFGLNPGQITINPQSYLQLVHPSDRDTAITIIHTCAATCQPFAFEHRVICQDGSTRWVLCKGKAVLTCEGNIERLVGASIDISEQKQAEKHLWKINKDLSRTEALLRNLNDELEHRVVQRTAELQAANEQINQLLDREKRARLEADSQRKQVESLFMQAPVALGIFSGPEHTIELANQALCTTWGIAQEKILNKPLFEALPEMKGQIFGELVQTVFTTGKPFIGNEIAGTITRKGKEYQGYLNLVYQPVIDPDGKTTGIISVVNEVTEQVAARKKVEESESRVLRILDSMPQIAWTANAEGKNTFLNKKWYEFSGVELTKSFHEVSPFVIHEEDKVRARKQWKQSVSTGEPLQIEYRIRRWDGEFRWVLVRALPLLNELGAITEWVGTVTDIHEQKQIMDFLYMVLEAIPHLAWTSQPEKSSVNYYNKRWYQYTALNETQSFGSGWHHVLHPDDFALTVERITAGRREGKPWEVENRYLRAADNMYRWHLSRAVPIRDESGNITLWVGTATDIHDQKMAQHELEQTLRELNDKNFELDQFVYKTSHDLRAPLSTVLGLVTILKQEKEEAAKANYVDLIENRVHKLDKFIKSMLDYSKNTRTGITCEKINLEVLLQECLQELEYMRHFGRLNITLNIDQKEFYSDVFRLKIIFSNLISNAIKYQDFAKQQSSLDIQIQTTLKLCTIRFMDNGVGIGQEYQDRIFNMFFRASDNAEGSGLGLYIVKQALGALNGSITFDSNVGSGTQFDVMLPVTVPAV